MNFFRMLRDNVKISVENACALNKLLCEEANKDIEALKQKYEQQITALNEKYLSTIEKMKNESLDAMIRRIVKEEVLTKLSVDTLTDVELCWQNVLFKDEIASSSFENYRRMK